ncbi:hypothetical protein Taro_009508 [Colocasia esculenta]|uniref:Uncharacterized protein n=1 Tax=Colocasia esculenta TaxID=4460 RepID=A0A843UA51_COLES|nr:hypothetical protein [Colocasia esculenta]
MSPIRATPWRGCSPNECAKASGSSRSVRLPCKFRVRAAVCCSCCCVVYMVSVVTRCVHVVVARFALDSLAVIFPVWRTVAGKSRCSVCCVASLVESCDTCLWLLSAWRWLVVSSGEVLPESFSVGSSGSEDCSVLISAVAVLPQGLRYAIVLAGAFWLCVLVKVLPKIALCHFWRRFFPGLSYVRQLLALLVEVLPKAASCVCLGVVDQDVVPLTVCLAIVLASVLSQMVVLCWRRWAFRLWDTCASLSFVVVPLPLWGGCFALSSVVLWVSDATVILVVMSVCVAFLSRPAFPSHLVVATGQRVATAFCRFGHLMPVRVVGEEKGRAWCRGVVDLAWSEEEVVNRREGPYWGSFFVKGLACPRDLLVGNTTGYLAEFSDRSGSAWFLLCVPRLFTQCLALEALCRSEVVSVAWDPHPQEPLREVSGLRLCSSRQPVGRTLELRGKRGLDSGAESFVELSWEVRRRAAAWPSCGVACIVCSLVVLSRSSGEVRGESRLESEEGVDGTATRCPSLHGGYSLAVPSFRGRCWSGLVRTRASGGFHSVCSRFRSPVLGCQSVVASTCVASRPRGVFGVVLFVDPRPRGGLRWPCL